MKKEEIMNLVEGEAMNTITVIDHKKEYKRLNSAIQTSMRNLETNFVKLAVALHEVDCGQFYGLDGYKSIVEYAKDKFGIQKTTVYNYLALVDRFGLTADSKPYFTSQQMIAMLPALKNGALVDDFSADMSVRDIKAKAKTFKKSVQKSKDSLIKKNPVDSGLKQVLPAMEIPADVVIDGELLDTLTDMILTLHKEGKTISIFAV